MNRVVFVKAFFKPITQKKVVKVPTGETKKGFFGGEKEVFRTEEQLVETGYSKSEIDGRRLAVDLAEAVKALNEEGLEVISMTEVTSGKFDFRFSENAGTGTGWGYGYGYSFTEGVLVVAREST